MGESKMEIPEYKYLGFLCERGHDFEGTGMSLRYKSNGGCIECKKEDQKTEKFKEHRRKYRQSEKYKEYQKKYHQTEKYKESLRKYYRKIIKNLDNKYIEKLLHNNFGLKLSEVTPELIKNYRFIVICERLIRDGKLSEIEIAYLNKERNGIMVTNGKPNNSRESRDFLIEKARELLDKKVSREDLMAAVTSYREVTRLAVAEIQSTE